MIGTLKTTSDSVGAYTANRVYTAFGEEITTNTDRYGYAGDWGYQSHVDMPYQHVGARYYDPSTGRFLQRDPIGIAGGLNVYVYVLNNPVVGIDPSGHGWLGDFWSGRTAIHDWVARNYWLRFHSTAHINSNWATAEAIGISVIGGFAAGAAIGGFINGLLPSRIAYFIRFEAHNIGGLTGPLRYIPLWHINIGRSHYIFDPRYWWSAIKSAIGCG